MGGVFQARAKRQVDALSRGVLSSLTPDQVRGDGKRARTRYSAGQPASRRHPYGEARNYADDQPAGPQGPHPAEGQVQGPCDGAEPAEARCLHPRLYDDPEEAELGSA